MQTEKPFLFVVAAWQQNSRYPKLKWQCKVYPGFSLCNLRVAGIFFPDPCSSIFYILVVEVLWLVFPQPSLWMWALMMSKHGYLMIDRKGQRKGFCHSCGALSRMTELRRSELENFAYFCKVWLPFSCKWMNHTMQFRALPTKKGDVKAWIEILAQTQPNLLRLVASTWDNLVDTPGTL